MKIRLVLILNALFLNYCCLYIIFHVVDIVNSIAHCYVCSIIFILIVGTLALSHV